MANTKNNNYECLSVAKTIISTWRTQKINKGNPTETTWIHAAPDLARDSESDKGKSALKRNLCSNTSSKNNLLPHAKIYRVTWAAAAMPERLHS